MQLPWLRTVPPTHIPAPMSPAKWTLWQLGRRGKGGLWRQEGKLTGWARGPRASLVLLLFVFLGFHFFQYLSVWDSESSSAMSSLYNPSGHLPLSGPGFHQEEEMTSEGPG